MEIALQTLLRASVALIVLPVPALAQAQSTSAPAAQTSADQTTAPPGSAPATSSTTSPQGPSQVGQSTAAQAPAVQQDGLQDIIVTAQARGENSQKAAVAIAVVSGADLINANVRGLDTLQQLAPALSVTSGSQGNLIFIRGVGNYSFTPGTDPAAAFNLDGVYVSRSSSTFGAFYDLERVEILKGPQGTLYGRNATAGAINVLPVQPHLGETSGYVVGSYGNFNSVDVEGALNAGFGDNAALRVSGNYARHDGYLSDGTQNDRTASIRAQLKVKLTPALTVRVEGDYAHQGGSSGGDSYVGTFAFSPVTGLFTIAPSGLPIDSGLFSPIDQAYRTSNGTAGSLAGRFLDPLIYRPYNDNSTYGIGVHADLQTPIGTLSVLPAWRHAKKNNLSSDAAAAVGDNQDQNQYSVEARLVSNQGHLLDYILGAYYFSEEINDDTHTGSGTTNSYTISHYTTHSPAFYGRLTLHATDWLRFTGGVRYTEDHKTFSNQSTVLIEACPSGLVFLCSRAPLLPYTLSAALQPVAPAPGRPPVLLAPGVIVIRADSQGAGTFSEHKVNYRGAVELDVGPRSLLYASVETGYRAGGFNTFSTFNPENITAYTIGSKNRFLDNRLQLNAEVFYWKYKDQQLSYLGFEGTPPSLGVLTHNVGASTNKGFELEGRALVTPTTTLSADAQYLDAKYDSFSYTSPLRPFTGCAVTQSGPLFTIDCSGLRAINSPKWTVNFGGEQVIPIGDYQIALSADAQYRSGSYIGSDYISTEYVSRVWTTNAQVSFGAKDGKYLISAFIRNINNNRAPVYGSPAPASNLIVNLPAPPRLYGLRLSARF